MIRDLGQSVSAIDIEDNSVIAGGWDGLLKEWNGDGDLIWSAQCQDRIEAILRVDDKVIVTSGSTSLVRVQISLAITGEIKPNKSGRKNKRFIYPFLLQGNNLERYPGLSQ